MKRAEQISRISDQSVLWDVAIIGGGATGLGAALDAASRGLKTVLIEQADFTKGTSSKSTKLLHGGVRYLAQGNLSLVLEALHERGLLLRNAPHLVKNQSFIIPVYHWWDGLLYTIGLGLYDLLAGSLSFGRSKFLGKNKVLEKMPHLKRQNLCGGVIYHDGQFDDSRLAINIAQSCVEHGGCVVNYVRATGLMKDAAGKINGVKALDLETGWPLEIKAKAVVNAAGVFVDSVIKMDTPGAMDMVVPSQGIHLVLDKSWLSSQCAMMIPKTSDGRVLFAVPWHDKLIVGTTDTLVQQPQLEPKALPEEISFILKTAGNYLSRQPDRKDVLSVFAGLRPLAAPKASSKDSKTKEISRSHKIISSGNGLVTVIGGKWTSFRKMAQDTIDQVIRLAALKPAPCITKKLKLHGYQSNQDFSDYRHVYGTDAVLLQQLEQQNPEYAVKLHPDFDYRVAEVIWACRHEMARNVEDVLARRLRLLLLDARASIALAPTVAKIMAQELQRDAAWVEQQVQAYQELASDYVLV